MQNKLLFERKSINLSYKRIYYFALFQKNSPYMIPK